jgi:hypothetical protein
MALVFYRRLAAPLWAIAFITVALTAPPPSTLFVIPPTNLFVIAVVGMAMFVFTIPGRGFRGCARLAQSFAIPWSAVAAQSLASPSRAGE